ncbi:MULTISPECIES: SMI1/KNR4 family protein [unclassified Nocardioides]|uniref:SMI1/KNR4 family protein n=1 Tax=unclassified Nocardioides TaxID=2615069 RepID=UPI0007033D0A|nr:MULTISPECIES: SMI1/KNR4 family protein [unclassified Nocardioides]KRC53020.1 hypothetical protein ASE19_11550 [Nocardioides sp. Root79]KRC72549.1 hypothetical protein ASE20_08080 [Nocardioides sp. Root240]
MFGRRRREQARSTSESVGAAGPDNPDVVLAQTIARHFEGAEVSGSAAAIGLGGVIIDCRVDQLVPTNGQVAASLFFNISGGALGTAPIFASSSGYGTSDLEAIVEGGCAWSCSFGPVLRSALADEPEPDVDTFDVALDGRPFRAHVAALNRLMGTPGIGEPGDVIRRTREALVGDDRWLTRKVLDSGTLPLVSTATATVLSAFVMELSDHRTVEVKVNGREWVASNLDAFAGPHVGAEGTATLMRELAVLVPQGGRVARSVPFRRDSLQRTLDGFEPATAEPWRADGWQGWSAHRGALGRPLDVAEVRALEAAAGQLPPDYRAFLVDVAGSGAGPGYGLIRPAVVGDGVIPLAHAGCGVTWILRLDPDHRGEVWVDAAGADETFTQVAPTFSEWYDDWLESALRGGVWSQWDNSACATTGVLNQLITSLDERGELGPRPINLQGRIGPGGIALSLGAGYLPEGSAGDPCHPCVALASRFGLGPAIFSPGVLLQR